MTLTILLKLSIMLDIDEMRKVTELDYQKKKIGSFAKYDNVVKMFFDFFSKTAERISVKMLENV